MFVMTQMASQRFWHGFVWLLLGLIVVSAGCFGKPDLRQPVSGTIKLKGAPLDNGQIEFIPLAGTAGGSKSGAMITNGTYDIPKDSGLIPGKYRVVLTAPDGGTPIPSDQPPGPSGNFASKDRISEEYNMKSTLEFEVKEGVKNEFNFDVP